MSYQGSEFDSRVVLAQEAKISASAYHGVRTVGTTSQVIVTLTAGTLGLFIQADPNNTADIYVGEGASTNATSEYFAILQAGAMLSLTVDTDNLPAFYAISTLANQKLSYLVSR